MSTVPYVNTTQAGIPTYPLVMFARSRGLSTAELTASHLRQFLRWSWQVEPLKNKLCELPGPRMTTYWKKVEKKKAHDPKPKVERNTTCKSG